jgi:nudix-type nucleoside diphosphatase (YffH/AdpP family)
MPQLRRAEIRKQTRVFDGFFKIEEVAVSHERPDGTMSPEESRLVFERGDAAAIVLLNVDSFSVVVVEQFRVPPLVARRRSDPNTTNGWITEAIAGMVDENETPEQTIIRETMEETGYHISNPTLITRFFSSPGGTSERIFLYFAEVRDADRIGRGGGLEGEDVKVLHVPLLDLFALLDNGSIEDPKLAIGAYWRRNAGEAIKRAIMPRFRIA